MHTLPLPAIVPLLLLLVIIFIPAQQSFADDFDQASRAEQSDIEKIIEHDFTQYDPHYIATRAGYAEQVKKVTGQLVTLQSRGAEMPCSEQMLIEALWLLNSTANWDRLDAQLKKLTRSLENTNQVSTARQSPEDGAWGLCYEAWFLKVDATIDALNYLADEGKMPSYPLAFLRRIGSIPSLLTYLKGLLISDVARTGVDKRDELGAVTGALSQLLFKDSLQKFVKEDVLGFAITGNYLDAYQRFLDYSQDTSTGYWGPWYRSGGQLYKSVDLSLTFHVISYRHGNVQHWPQIIDTTLSIKNYEYPHGWMHNGRYEYHNNYDVVRILRYGWPHMSGVQREQARAEIRAMLHWALSNTVEPEKLFAVDPTFYSSPAHYIYYGISFFDEIGYWDKSRRFWTDEDFPEVTALCQAIRAKLASLNRDNPSAYAAAQKFDANCSAG